MATTILNSLIIQASRMIQEYRTDAGTGGDSNKRFKSSNWTDYTNRALRDLLRDKLAQLGSKQFAEQFAEYIKTSGVLTVVSGSVSKPSDALWVLEVAKSDLSIWYDRVPEEEVMSVKTGRNMMIVPTSTKPVFWEENGSINTLGLTAGNIVARYIEAPSALAVITSAAGNGKKNTANGQYTAATKLLQATMSTGFAAGDENRVVMFYDNAAGKVYYGTIASVKDADEVYLSGDGLPAANIAAGSVTIVLMEQLQDADVKLKSIWHGELLERIVKYALADTIGSIANVSQG
jgi:hypothetical protein